MNVRENLIRRIKDTLAIYAVRIDLDKGEASRAAENFYCGLLNILKGYDLRNMNLEKPNYPAIDLGDAAEGLGVQVTSTATRQKVQDTLDAMFRNGVEQDYPHLVMLVTKEWRDSRKAFRMDGACRFDPNADIWDTNWLLAQLDGIEALEKLEEIRDYLTKHLHLVREPAPAFDLPLRTAMRKNDFLGREAELARISEEFEKDPIVVLSGLGGMGKTELAVRYGQEYQESGRGWAYFLHFTGSFGMTLRSNVHRIIPDYSVEGKSDAQIEADALAALNRGGKADLLILDNAEQVSIPKLRRELSALRMRVLVTTRKDVAGIVEVKPLPRKALYAIFERNEVDATKEEMDALIDEVDSHTLTVDVMARTMRRGRRAATAEKLLAALRERDLSKGFTKVEIDYAGSPEQARINEHLKAVFRVAELTEEEQRVLCYATLLPTSGMSDELFLAPFSDETKDEVSDVLDNLIDKGWLTAKEGLLLIHPIIRIVCREELKPTDENCGVFLNGLWVWYDQKDYDMSRFFALAEVFSVASDDLEDRNGEWALRAGEFWKDVGEYSKTLNYFLKIVEKREQNQENSYELATAYSNVSYAYGAMENHKGALDYMLKALTLWEKHNRNEASVFSEVHNYRCAHCITGNHPRTIIELTGGWTIKETIQPYVNVYGTYGKLDSYERTLEYKISEIISAEALHSQIDLHLAVAYDNMGYTCISLKNYHQALQFIRKAQRAFEDMLPPDHPDLAVTYNNMGSAYSAMGDHVHALEWRRKALDVGEKSLSVGHPTLAVYYNNLGETYGNMGDFARKLEYHQKALRIWEQALPDDHLNIVTCCRSIAESFAQLGEFSKAVEYANRALKKAEKSMRGSPMLEQYKKLVEIMEHLVTLQAQGTPFANLVKE